ncbi:hypothetical protein JCGZ_21814 [Jatropha curcas]|uniref:Proteinase inhibitor n=1 Tax=Jatropha curcas TaxID=180498 RepID=A0A067JF03_JATCU|nr:hypothetical protein JCGZ_21814 [Jatropha curcas]
MSEFKCVGEVLLYKSTAATNKSIISLNIIHWEGREGDTNTGKTMARELCPGKSSWPELLGTNGEAAAATIEKENTNVDAIVVKEGTGVIEDFRCNRVWVWVNEYGVVTQVPTVG